ncbi:MAG TPA: glycoside hydrolase family 13 protein [Ardenticatenaceae bacterium]|nr:glycoside hydrolase family 13 protein [Ardenticatenaceae bacterium]
MVTSAQTTSTITVKTPDWVKDAVFYQIFPDRFARSDRVMKPNNLQQWGQQPTVEGYQGGDLLGVVEHLDHLVDLGITAIYFTPIFQSASNHRYHTHDYYRVDPMLGGNEALRTLVEEAHRRNIRVVLDGVFNHASRGFFQFSDILEHGPHSAWLDWFTVEGWPLSPYDGSKPANYVSWVGNRALPKLNTDNLQVREFIMQVAEYWLREADIDGWRLDVPEEIKTQGFWEEFRQRVKAVKPEAYIVGEVWREAREWLQGDRFDATMNYLFTSAVIAFTARDRVSHALVKDRSYDPYPGIDAAQFGARIQRLLNLYDWEITLVQLNLLDSHDTARLLSIARGDKATVRLATLFQMTYPGAPSIYYGDEIGLRGTLNYDAPHQDPDARWAFPWHDRASWDTELLAYFKAAIALRHAHPVLRRGHFYQLYAQGDCFAFARRSGEETLIVALNTGDDSREIVLPVGAYFRDGVSFQPLFGQGQAGRVDDGQATVVLPGREGLVFGAATG